MHNIKVGEMYYWSNRNYLYESEKNGILLWVGNTGSLLRLNTSFYNAFLESPQEALKTLPEEILLKLEGIGAIHEDTNEEHDKRLRLMSYRHRFNPKYLTLTLAVTNICNFTCDYCIESKIPNNIPKIFDDETCDSIISLIKRRNPERTKIIWYGGEPLLGFDRIEHLSGLIKENNLNVSYSLITNGYLLDEKTSSFLVNKKIEHIQITIDGVGGNHNNRRAHRSDPDSFSAIIRNIKILHELIEKKKVKTSISIRVNIDDRNPGALVEVMEYFKKNVPGKYKIYPGFVQNTAYSCNSNCAFTNAQKSEYLFDLLIHKGISTTETNTDTNGQRFVPCGASVLNNYIIDWNGDAYKCWDDIGIEHRVVFNINSHQKLESDVESKYILESDQFSDPNCRKCGLVFLCAGGCPSARVQGEGFNKADQCHILKKSFNRYLDYLIEK